MRLRYSKRKLVELFANSEDPDQTPHSAASDLGLHCLPITLLGVSRVKPRSSSFPTDRWFLCFERLWFQCGV